MFVRMVVVANFDRTAARRRLRAGSSSRSSWTKPSRICSAKPSPGARRSWCDLPDDRRYSCAALANSLGGQAAERSCAAPFIPNDELAADVVN